MIITKQSATPVLACGNEWWALQVSNPWPLPCESESPSFLAWVDCGRDWLMLVNNAPQVTVVVHSIPFDCGPDVAPVLE
jgi:hypothetical protein